MNVREAWLRTELFSQKLALSAGRLDLTNYFDRNAVANDETFQFISDALVNNPMLGLGEQRRGRRRRVRSRRTASPSRAASSRATPTRRTCRNRSISLVEVDYIARLPGLSEGNYRFWFRNDNSTSTTGRRVGISLDQKLTPQFGAVRPLRLG